MWRGCCLSAKQAFKQSFKQDSVFGRHLREFDADVFSRSYIPHDRVRLNTATGHLKCQYQGCADGGCVGGQDGQASHADCVGARNAGLAAAIPAVVIYNMFSRSIAQYRALYADTSVEILTMVSRDLVQRYPAAAPAAE